RRNRRAVELARAHAGREDAMSGLRRYFAASAALLLVPVSNALAQPQGVEILTVQTGADGGETWSVSLQVLVFMTLLGLLPALLITMTSFTRILVVLAILRQGLGTQQTPSNQLLVGIALFLSFFVMAPVGERIYAEAVEPYLESTISAPSALEAAAAPLREFMLAHTRQADLALFASLAGR